jgi:hypothetical protein
MASLLLLVTLMTAAFAADDAKKDDSKTEKMEDSEYYPLKIGTVWHYKLGDNKFILKAVKDEKVGDKPSVRVEMIGDGDKTMSYENINVAKDGVYRLAFEGNKADPAVKFLQLPPKADEKWDVNSTIGKEKLKGTFKIDKTEKIKVPAGEYDTIAVSSDDLDANGMKVSFKSYYARKVGMVRQVIKIGSQEVVIELEKFEEAK